MGTAKEQGHGRKSYKVFSLNPLYQIEEDYWNICLNKSWGMSNPAILSPKVLNHTKFVAWQCIFLHSGLTLNHAFSLGHGFSIIKVLPTPDKRAAKEQGHGRKTYKVFSLNPLYQSQEDYWNIYLNKSWGMNNPAAIFSPNSAELSQEHKMTQYYFA